MKARRPVPPPTASPRPGARRRAALLVAPSPTRGGAGADWSALADALQAELPAGWHVTFIVRHDASAIATAVRALASDGIEDLVVVPLEPAYSDVRTGVILQDLCTALRAHPLNVSVRTAWYDDAGYVHALARYLAEPHSSAARGVDDAELRFVAPVPDGTSDRRDFRYERQMHRTAELCAARLGWPADRWSIAFAPTSGVACVTLASADGAPRRRTVTCELPFPAEPGPIGDARRPPLWSTAPFVGALRSLVLHGPQRAPAGDGAPAPLLQSGSAAGASDPPPAELVMVGASVANGLGCGQGVRQQSSEPAALALAKARTRKALRAFLDWTRRETPLHECFVWNTCQRIELYGWLPATLVGSLREVVVQRIRTALFGEVPPAGLRINVLAGRAARHHLLRTACGLNSALPGDRDVIAQLQTAARIAQCAGTAGPRVAAMVDDATVMTREVAARTTWGRFSTGYCAAALARICEVDGVRPDRFRHVVVGGSTTSRSILSTLAEEHGVPHRQLTLVYRDHHGQMRQLRAALGSGRRIRVHAYGEAAVLRAIADADFVYFGIDQAEPVLDATALAGLRDYAVRPLTLVDFNTSGSLLRPGDLGPIALWSAKELDEAVAAQAVVTSSRSGFAAAVAEAEAWIHRVLPPAPDPGAPVPVRGGVGVWDLLR